MNCFAEWKCMEYLDGEMPSAEISAFEAHVLSCAECGRLVTTLRGEGAALRSALPIEIDTPAWQSVRPPSAAAAVRNLGVATGICLAIRWLAIAPPPGVGWILPEGVTGVLLWQGLQAIPLVGQFVTSLLGIAALVWCARIVLRSRRAYAAALLTGAVLLSVPANAATVRSGQNINVAASETLDDSLIAMGEIVRIDGTVNGDVLAFARRVEIRGAVKGNLYTFAQALDARGPVEGAVWSIAQIIDLGARVGGNVYAAGESVNVAAGAKVGEVLSNARTLTLEGEVMRGVLAAGSELIVRGPVGRGVIFHGEEVEVASTARIGGKLAAHVDDRRRVRITAPGVVAEVEERRSRYRDWSFYVGELASLAIALALAWIGWRLAPDFLDRCVNGNRRWWRSLLVGIAAAVLIPLLAILLAITWIGLPLAAIVAGVYLAAMYLAKIVVAAYLGKALLPARHPMVQIAAGLALILAALELPAGIGTAVWIVVFLAGLGALAWEMGRRIANSSPLQ